MPSTTTTPMSDAVPATVADILGLARRHGLILNDDLVVNEIGLDFRVATGTDQSGIQWVLRIPRRSSVWPRAEQEARTLRYLRKHLPVAVPDWQLAAPDLIAYPRLMDTTAMTVDPVTWEYAWHIDPASPTFCRSFAATLAALHALPHDEAVAAGVSTTTIEQVRQNAAADIDRVKAELGIAAPLEHRWRTWLDDDTSWPDFTVLIHGDLYAGHVLVDDNERVTGIIDWTEAGFNDPGRDFGGHLAGFSEQGLDDLLAAYEASGGRIWSKMRHHIIEGQAASPVNYAVFALDTGVSRHLEAVRPQLGLTDEC